jgi:hypothetical protein
MLKAALVRMVPEGTGIDRLEFVGEALAGLDRRLGQVRHAIHRVRHAHTVPVHGRALTKTVLDNDAQAISLADTDLGSGKRSVIAPNGCFRMWLRQEPDATGRCAQLDLARLGGMGIAPKVKWKHRARRACGGRCEEDPSRQRGPIEAGHGSTILKNPSRPHDMKGTACGKALPRGSTDAPAKATKADPSSLGQPQSVMAVRGG